MLGIVFCFKFNNKQFSFQTYRYYGQEGGALGVAEEVGSAHVREHVHQDEHRSPCATHGRTARTAEKTLYSKPPAEKIYKYINHWQEQILQKGQ